MNRTHTRQLAELALATRDADLLAKACQQLLAEIDQPVTLPLWQQPAIVAADHVAELDRALDNLPPVVYHQAPVQRVEVEETAPKASQALLTSYNVAWNVCKLWHEAYGSRWVSNTAAFGKHRQMAKAGNLRWMIVELVKPNPDMSQRAIGKMLWQRIEQLQPQGWLVQERVRRCSGYSVIEHSIVPAGKRWP